MTTEQTKLAHYIAALTGDLAAMAQRRGLNDLSFVLAMARLQADEDAVFGDKP